jgi:hypothetical protein
MFDKKRREAAPVDVMHTFWSGEKPVNLAPEIISLTLDGMVGTDNITCAAQSTHEAIIKVNDPDGDDLIYHWEILPENTEFGYGGQGEKKPDAVDCILTEDYQNTITFSAPEWCGDYRVSVTIYDEGGNHFAYGNIPFYVE